VEAQNFHAMKPSTQNNNPTRPVITRTEGERAKQTNVKNTFELSAADRRSKLKGGSPVASGKLKSQTE